jgi:hypothetical protein
MQRWLGEQFPCSRRLDPDLARAPRGEGVPSPITERGSRRCAPFHDRGEGTGERAGSSLTDWAYCCAAWRTACWRRRRSLRVSRPARDVALTATLGSGRGSVFGSRRSAGWPSMPDREQTMQQKAEPGRTGPRCGHAERGVKGPMGKRGISSGSRSFQAMNLSNAIKSNSRFRDSSRLQESCTRDDCSLWRARAKPSWIRRRPTPVRRAISRTA